MKILKDAKNPVGNLEMSAKNPRIFGTGVPIIGGADFPMTSDGQLFTRVSAPDQYYYIIVP